MLIVANLVALGPRKFAAFSIALGTSLRRPQFVGWVFAVTVQFAVAVLCSTLLVVAAAIASVPAAPAVVVSWIAKAVLVPFETPAESTTLNAWVVTPALRPTIVVVLILAAAISTIPSTNAVIIPVVADTIAFVPDLCALLSFADRVRTFRQLMRTITADTQFVVRLAELAAAGIGEAAVATVPIASPVVVFRVAETVSKPIGLPASTA